MNECLQKSLIDVVFVYCTQLAGIQPWSSFGNIFVEAAKNLLSLHQELKLACVWTAQGPVRFMPGVRWNTTRDPREHPLLSCSTLEICHFASAPNICFDPSQGSGYFTGLFITNKTCQALFFPLICLFSFVSREPLLSEAENFTIYIKNFIRFPKFEFSK